MPLPKFLYRGDKLHKHTDGTVLTPKNNGSDPEHEDTWGDGGTYGDGGTWGKSQVNGVIQHQFEQNSYEGSAYISTTPNLDTAIKYALYGGAAEAIVYVIDTELLAQHGVTAFRVKDHATWPSCPDDDEYSLLADPPGPLPQGIVVEVRVVTAPVSDT